jgi:hypothetical protein
MFKGGIPYIFQFFLHLLYRVSQVLVPERKHPFLFDLKFSKNSGIRDCVSRYSILNLVVGRKILLILWAINGHNDWV